MSFIEFLKRLDKIFFLLINHDSSYRYLDTIMLVLRNPLTWIPLYLFIIWYFFKKAVSKGWQIVLFSLVCVALTDSVSTLFKNIFERARPCYDTEISGLVRHLIDCGGEYSFPSSHAANHFGLATFLVLVHFKNDRKEMELALDMGKFNLLCTNLRRETFSF